MTPGTRRIGLHVDEAVQDASRLIQEAAAGGRITNRRAEILSGTILMACYGNYELSTRQYARRRTWLAELGIDLDALVDPQQRLLDDS